MAEKLDTSKIEAALERAAQKSMQGGREDRSGRFMAPRAFISYSHDSNQHKQWVLKLASDLRSMGVDVVLDQWDLVPGQDVSMFMQKGITEADCVVLVCSAPYTSKSEKGTGGVGYERLIVTAEVVQAIDTIKFIPVLRESGTTKRIPSFLGPRLYIDFEDDSEYEVKLVELARRIHGAPAVSKPPLGKNPFSIEARAAPLLEPSEARGAAIPTLDSEWFTLQESAARSGIQKLKLEASMELRASISCLLAKSQIELLNAVKHSEIRTFGWPIGVTLENREEYRPRPYGDGIRAEVSIGHEEEEGRKSYDYWALRSSGDFFLLQSLFEDSRRPTEIFFDTRIVRVTESLMFIERLYTKLGAPSESRVKVRVTHKGFKGRTLSSASPNRSLFRPRKTDEETSSFEFSVTLGDMERTRVDDVKNILAPMFMLFDYMEINSDVYADIVRKFEAGHVS
ncbi:hypothetical protein ACVWWG_000501 [Bradyrhizobium sp. LB7.2]|uniref:toll/interleukin-1 receptor domain-containing protein n=1 Tax=Bradyrhizobium sp. LB14.3 TaxID=3156328 RepID=UPI00339A13AA